MIDVLQQINAVHRTIGARTIEAGAGHVITISRLYDTSVDDLWDACTSAERLPRWFLPVSGELRVGGRYQLEGNAGGVIERCDPPHGFAATWEFDGSMSWIEVRFTDNAGQARLEIEHTVPDDDHWREFGPGAKGVGWESGLLGLTLHLGSGQAVDPQAYLTWAVSDEGLRFVTLSSEQWGEADLASGTDETTARAAAQRTTAAYTATPDDTPAR